MSLARRLYRGETKFDFVGTSKRWYAASIVLLFICALSFGLRGFNFGIEFEGGDSFKFPAGAVSLEEASTAVSDTGVDVVSSQFAGSGATRQVLVRTPEITTDQESAITENLIDLGLDRQAISIDSVSSSWGGDVTRKAILGLVVFLVAVTVFISLRFEWRMSVGAMVALFHDLVITAGVYSLVGFEVSPSTIVGLLTILGFSLYDTVVVFDKVSENTHGILAGARTTYSEQANLAVNQTLMRSINTSLTALLPVAGLLFVGAGLLGVGTIKDLALVLFVGLAVGAYSSLFLATPVLCDLKERDPKYAALTKRVLGKRRSLAAAAEAAAVAEPDDEHPLEPVPTPVPVGGTAPPKPGARPVGRNRRGKRR